MKQTLRLVLLTLLTTLVACGSVDHAGIGKGEIAKPMFLRGDFSLWEARDDLKLEYVSPFYYRTKLKLKAYGKAYEFKIADDAWSPGFNCGYKAESDKVIKLGQIARADCDSVFNYFSFVPPEDGWYWFEVIMPVNKTPSITVRKAL